MSDKPGKTLADLDVTPKGKGERHRRALEQARAHELEVLEKRKKVEETTDVEAMPHELRRRGRVSHGI